jgi:glycosyltransferase involved in cell wall biosynthesis
VKFLLLNQTFYPDVASTGQHLADLALALVERGHEVTVITSRRAYDKPQTKFPKTETWRGIRIVRINSTGFGKGAKWKRAADFGTFMLCCAAKVATIRRPDAIVALTSPPLISFLGALLAKFRRCRFFYWVMDLNPDEALAAGWLRPRSLITRGLDWMSCFSFNQANKIIVLDRFMRDRVLAKGIAAEKIAVMPPWSHDDEVRFDEAGRQRFRQAHGLDGKFVVMYSGNHSPCHPLDTLLEAARRMAPDREVAFCFIGGGSEWRKIRANLDSSSTPGILCLPYQPLDSLAGVLSAADLHVVVMGNSFVGIVHPCKIYNVLSVSAPVLCIGPQPSHLSEILATFNGQYRYALAAHGDVKGVMQKIAEFRDERSDQRPSVPNEVRSLFAKQTILPKLIAELEKT